MTKQGPLPPGLARLWRIGAEVYDQGTATACLKRLVHLALLLPDAAYLEQWLRCENNPALAREIERSGVITRQLHRPYVHREWTLRQRLEFIAQHYLALATPPASLLDLAEDEYFDLVALGDGYTGLRLVIDRPGWMRTEGEIAISLFQDIHRMYAAMLLIQGTSGDQRLLIGALQGSASHFAKETYAKLTRDLHGARPRDFMVSVTKMLAAALGYQEIWGLSDDKHRSKHWLVRVNKHACFDEVWRDNGGVLNDAGFYAMGTDLRRREPAEIPQRKRALYRRRYELFDRLEEAILDIFRQGKRTLMHHQRPV